MAAILGVDIGGTFTDLVLLLPDGTLRIHKRLSTPDAPARGFLHGLDEMHAPTTAAVAHGTTVATNALLEGKTARTALITTHGFRDLLRIGRQNRPHLYRLTFAPPQPPVPDELTFTVRERVSATGEVLCPLSAEEVEAALEAALAGGAESLAVCLLFSFLHPAHEQAIGAQARARGLFVSLSSDILPEFREFERASTTVLNAAVAPIMSRYLGDLDTALRRRGHPALWVMQSSGGMLSAAHAAQEAVRTALSGPAAGVIGAVAVARQAGIRRVITFDMGGTSTDVALADGAVQRTTEGQIAGWPMRLPMIDIHTVGAGGGSIAWVDAGGSLRVGPQSAGSAPGPACYGLGGTAFTVTDANLLLGRLPAAHFLGGRMRLDADAARQAAQPLAAALGLSVPDLAEGVLRVANAAMEQAIRVISVERGHDPRDFTLVPFGGAGPMHALELAQALRIRRVLVPRHPGVLSALGLVLADFVRDYSQTVMWPLETLQPEALQAALDALQARGTADLQAEGFPTGRIRLEPALDLRYRGQSYELTVPLTALQAERIAADFHAAHARRYGYAQPGAPIEVVNLRLTARGLRPAPSFAPLPQAPSPDPAGAVLATQPMRFHGRPYPTPILDRERLCAGHRLHGPALLVQPDATVVIPPGWEGTVDVFGHVHLEAG